jgi:hypothetical protein
MNSKKLTKSLYNMEPGLKNWEHNLLRGGGPEADPRKCRGSRCKLRYTCNQEKQPNQ